MSNRKPIFWLISLNLLLFCGFGIHRIYKSRQANDADEQAIKYVAETYERLNVMPQEDYRRVVQLRESIKQTNSISDTDLDWWIELVNRPPASTSAATSRRLIALKVNFRSPTQITPQQKDRLFDLAKSYLPAQGASTGPDIFFGVALVSSLDEKRAAPLLTPLLNRAPASLVRQMSEKLLKKWRHSPTA